MGDGERPWRPTTDGLVIRFRLTPKASANAIGAIEATAEGPAVKAKVRAVPADGAANAALERLVADWLDVPKSSVSLVSGGKSRIKSLAVRGEPCGLIAAAEALTGDVGAHPQGSGTKGSGTQGSGTQGSGTQGSGRSTTRD